MGYIADEITTVSTQLKIEIQTVAGEESITLKKKLADSFSTDPNLPERFSWQNLTNYSSIHDSAGWKKIAAFTPEKPVILFVNPELESTGWYFASGQFLVDVLAESCGFPFYITSLEADYIICFDDHDCLLAAGTAKGWLESLPEFQTN
jgi:hypothetical protein